MFCKPFYGKTYITHTRENKMHLIHLCENLCLTILQKRNICLEKSEIWGKYVLHFLKFWNTNRFWQSLKFWENNVMHVSNRKHLGRARFVYILYLVVV